MLVIEALNKLENEIAENELDPESCTGALVFLGEIYPYLDNQEKCMEFSYSIMNILKKEIQENTGVFSGLGAFGGLTEILFATKIFYKKTGVYEKFLHTLESIVCQEAISYTAYCKDEIEQLKVIHYDLINGLTGIAMYYLWDRKVSEQEDFLLKEILDYFVTICCAEKTSMQGWHIKTENQYRIQDIEEYPHGSIDFGLSHGMMGPLMVMAEAYSKKIVVEGLKEAICQLIDLYMRFKKDIQGVYHWPSQLDFADFQRLEWDTDKRNNRVSWCYGNIGISRALYLVGKNISDGALMEFAYKNIIGIADLDSSTYKLDSAILCHGYGGILSILNVMNRENDNRLLYEKEILLSDIVINSIASQSDVKGNEAFHNFLYSRIGELLSLISLFARETVWERWLYLV